MSSLSQLLANELSLSYVRFNRYCFITIIGTHIHVHMQCLHNANATCAVRVHVRVHVHVHVHVCMCACIALLCYTNIAYCSSHYSYVNCLEFP